MKKPLPVVWHPKAIEELNSIIAGIAADNPRAAHDMYELIHDSVRFIGKWPYLFPESRRLNGCREIVAHRNYLLFYRVGKDKVQVVAVYHGRRNIRDAHR